MSIIKNIIKSVERTHPGLGRLVAFLTVASIARKCVLVVAPAGCGKSSAGKALYGLYYPNAFALDSCTRNGLKWLQEKISNFNGLVYIDDLGKVDTSYSRMATITTFAELCYSHFVEKITNILHIKVENYFGSAIMNIQPVLMQELVSSPEWEAVIRDKTIRYYHLFRPLKPNKALPEFPKPKSFDIDEVKLKLIRRKTWYELLRIGLIQWSYARCVEHIPDMIRAVAAIEGDKTATVYHMKLLLDLMRPLILERYLLEKSGFESGIYFHNNAYCILVELATHKTNLTVETVSVDYKMSYGNAARVLKTVPEWCILKNSPGRVLPTKHALKVLKMVGAW